MPEELSFKGFFDLQVNGFKSVDFSSRDLTEDGFVFSCRELQKKGIVGFLPTMISSEVSTYKKNLGIMARVSKYPEFKKMVPGIHLEGPFISGENGYRGIHPLKHIRKPDIDFLNQLIKWSDNTIKMMTISAEQEGAEKLCRYAVSKGIVISLGHQDADEKQIDRMVRNGARSLTHLGNGLPHLVHRHVNPIWIGMGNEFLTAMIIADGFHLPVSVIKTIIKSKGVKNTILVSDLSPLGGLKPGSYKIWGTEVSLATNGFLFDPVSGYLAASSFSLLECANFLLSRQLVKLEDLYRMTYLNPLNLLGIHPARYRDAMKLRLRGKRLVVER